MKDRRKGDHYVEYLMASKEVDEYQKMIMSATLLDPSIDTSHASMALSEALIRKTDAIEKYNDMVVLMKTHISTAKECASINDISGALFHITCLLESAFNTEPLPTEEENVKTENLHS